MNDEQWILLALLGTGAAASGFAASRIRVEAPTEWHNITWPRDVDEHGVAAFFRQLAGDRRRHAVALEIVARGGRLTYRLGLAERHAEHIASTLSSHVAGAVTAVIDNDSSRPPDYSWRVTLKGQHRALRTDLTAESARALTTALADASAHTTVFFQWLLGPRLTPVGAPATGSPRPASSWQDVVKQALSGAKALDVDERRAIREKVEEAGFQATCRIGVQSPHAQDGPSVASRVLAALRMAETPGVRLGLRKENPGKVAGAPPAPQLADSRKCQGA